MNKLSSILVALILTLIYGCASVPPMLNANIDGKSSISEVASIAIAPRKLNDNGAIWNDTLSVKISKSQTYSSIGSIYYTRSFLHRLEIGVGLVGLYQKFLIIKPVNYENFSLKNIALSEFFSSGFSIFAEHANEAQTNIGLLAGIPINRKFSITTGLYYQNIHNYNSSFTKWDNVWEVGIISDRKRLIIPLNLFLKFYLKKTVVFISTGFEYPLELQEKYKAILSHHYDEKYRTEYRSLIYNNTRVILFKMSIGLRFYNRYFDNKSPVRSKG